MSLLLLFHERSLSHKFVGGGGDMSTFWWLLAFHANVCMGANVQGVGAHVLHSKIPYPNNAIELK